MSVCQCEVKQAHIESLTRQLAEANGTIRSLRYDIEAKDIQIDELHDILDATHE